MKILIVCKRQYTNRDLLDDCYGRLFEIPEELSKIENEVKGITISYRRKKEGKFKPQNIAWHSVNGYPFINLTKVREKIDQIIMEFNPDVVWASSDAFIISTTANICINRKIPIVIDFYDNYESFNLTKLPFVKNLLRKSCEKAAGITTVTTTLSKFIYQNYKTQHIPIIEIGNAASPIFFPRDKKITRKLLNLPENGILIGTAGALDKSRGIDILFKAFFELKKTYNSIFLVIAGPRDGTINKFPKENIIDLGILTPSTIPLLFNSLDVAIICNKDSDFGKYCYPQKYEEIVACHVPLLAANVGELSLMLAHSPINLFDPQSHIDLSEKIEYLLNSSNSPKLTSVSTWKEKANILNSYFQNLIRPSIKLRK